jgi:DNA-binding transcriptional LysR family regulator
MDAHLRDLRYFVAVAEELNFTRAAERLHLSQPALSKQIRGLETTLRAQLFRRDRRQVELTGAGAALHAVARSLLQDWDDGVAVVGDAAAQDARVLRVGTLTSIGRALYPAITDQFAKRQPGWQVELHTYGWGDPTAGLRDHTSDAAFVWLPIDAADVETVVLATERRFVAISARHPLADRQTIEFSEIVNEPVAALPASAGSQRDFWLAIDARVGQPPMVAAEVNAADEKFEIVSSGAAITLLAEGNADIYLRKGIVCIPVSGLEPAQLAIAWRRGDRRPAIRDFIQASRDAAGTQSGTSRSAARIYPRRSPATRGSSRSSATRNPDSPDDQNGRPSCESGPQRTG